MEAVLICVDNSEYARNGDYSPSRLKAQEEAIHLITNAKLNSNPDTTVGLLTMAGKRIEVLVSPTQNSGAIMTASSKLKIDGKCNFTGALKTAQLALKNRPNKNAKQRIIMFVGSPVESEAKELEVLGKFLKKNSVAVDVVNFGTENGANDNSEKLEALVSADKNNNHLVIIPPGPHILADLLLDSPLLQGGAGGAPSSASGLGAMADEDPEFAMALRMSMEEEKQRQQQQQKPTSATTTTTPAAAQPAAAAANEDVMVDDDELARAIALSMEIANTSAPEPTPVPAPISSSSSSSSSTSSSTAPQVAAEDIAASLQDQDLVAQLLQEAGIEGDVDINALLKDAGVDQSKQQPKKDDKDKDAKK